MVDQSAPEMPHGASIAELKNTAQFVGFQVDGQEYAIRIEQIQEIVILEQVTRTPQVGRHVEGVTNLRGAIIPIINLRSLFGLPILPKSPDSRTIVVNVGTRTMGCTVDTVTQVIRIPIESIQTAPETVTSDGATYLNGFVRLDDRLVIVLNIDDLLDPTRLQCE